MAYTINLTNGNVFATIPDGTINTTSSMTLIGKNYAGYGQFLDDNFIHLLECGANSTPPSAPLTGQLWFNTTSSVLNVYNGTGFKPIGGAAAASTAPTNNTVGDLWYDTVNAQLNVWTGTQWLLVGPVYTANTGITGAIPTTVVDNSAQSHVVIQLYVGASTVGFISKDAAFTPQTPISGFTTIRPGITLSTLVGSQVPLFQGTATTALNVAGIAANAVPDLNANNTFTGNVTIQPPAALTVSNILNAGTAGTGNIGNSTTPFGTIFATATSAQYADLAERFEADELYESGTVVELGGSAEITSVTEELSDRVFGVISTRAAYLMNGAAGTDATHPPVAMTGRVPVKVTGIVNKGDRLVSAGNGIARAAKPGEATAFNVIGRALVSKKDTDLGTVEAIVTIK